MLDPPFLFLSGQLRNSVQHFMLFMLLGAMSDSVGVPQVLGDDVSAEDPPQRELAGAPGEPGHGGARVAHPPGGRRGVPVPEKVEAAAAGEGAAGGRRPGRDGLAVHNWGEEARDKGAQRQVASSRVPAPRLRALEPLLDPGEASRTLVVTIHQLYSAALHALGDTGITRRVAQ